MIISGVAEQLASKIRSPVYLDAFVPDIEERKRECGVYMTKQLA